MKSCESPQKKKMSPGSDRGRNGVELNLEDLTCPVCLEIFMEPVTLPCTHTFCKECFLESVDKATLCCPLCRKRVSTWARLNSKNKTLINQQLWTQIQTRFPLQCQRRVSGQEDSAEDDQHTRLCFPRVSEPGELRQEYEDQVTRLTEEKRALEEEQSRASEEFIQRLLQEEERLQQEETKRREEDERLAQLLSDQLNSSSVSQVNVPPADVTPAKKKKKKEVVGVGQMERFLCRRPAPSSSSSSLTANKENILATERPLPSLRVILDYHGPDPDLDLDLDLDLIDERGASSSAKRKSSEDEEVTVNKRLCHCPPASSSTTSSSSSSSSLLLGGSQWEVELQTRRQQQEEEDRRLAELLQKELDQEERRKTPDRRKGSTDAYLLRQHHPQTENLSNSSRTTSRASTKTAKTSSPSTSSTSSIRGSKQATITEMFSGLSS